MHMISKKGLELFWNGYFDEVVQSYESHNRQWRSADAWRGHSVCQRIGCILDYESPRKHANSFIARKALRWTRIIIRVDQRSKKNHISLKTVFGNSATRKTSLRSWFLTCQQVLPSIFLLQHPWHLQSRKLIIPRLPQVRLLHVPWRLQLCQAEVWLDKTGKKTVWDRSLSRNCVK